MILRFARLGYGVRGFLAIGAPLVLSTTTVLAQLVVPSQKYKRIQSAIHDASFGLGGGTVLVRPGVYTERIRVIRKVHLKSKKGPEVTILDGSAFSGYEDALIDGFTIRNATNSGMWLVGFRGTVRNCRFVGNRGSVAGGIVILDHNGLGSPTIEDCRFERNKASPGSGGAILCQNLPKDKRATVTIRRCSFVENRAATYAAAIEGEDGSDLRIESCEFLGNRGMVSAVFLIGTGTLTMTNSRLAGNIGGGGAAVRFFGPSKGLLVNNTITGNTTGGIALETRTGVLGAPEVRVYNTILWRNGREIDLVGRSKDNRVPKITVSHCLVTGGYKGPGNFSADPRLANAPSGNHRLLVGSPCFQRGLNTAPGLPAIDFEGDPRVLDGRVEIGADELRRGAELLWADRASLSVSGGGSPKFEMRNGPPQGVFLLLPSLSGSQPGFVLGRVWIRLNPDAVTWLLLATFQGLAGPLDSAGSATRSLRFVGPMPPALAGRELSFASLFFGAGGLRGATNPERLFLQK